MDVFICHIPLGGLGGGHLSDSPLPHTGITTMTQEGWGKFQHPLSPGKSQGRLLNAQNGFYLMLTYNASGAKFGVAGISNKKPNT